MNREEKEGCECAVKLLLIAEKCILSFMVRALGVLLTSYLTLKGAIEGKAAPELNFH